MKIALAADHGGFEMKQALIVRLRQAGHEVTDFGAQLSMLVTTTRTLWSRSPKPWRPARSSAAL